MVHTNSVKVNHETVIFGFIYGVKSEIGWPPSFSNLWFFRWASLKVQESKSDLSFLKIFTNQFFYRSWLKSFFHILLFFIFIFIIVEIVFFRSHYIRCCLTVFLDLFFYVISLIVLISEMSTAHFFRPSLPCSVLQGKANWY